MFKDIYKQQETSEVLQKSMLQELGFDIPAGIYDKGVLSVLDIKSSKEFLNEWDWLFKEEILTLITTGLGNAFLLKKSSGEIIHLDSQCGEGKVIAQDIAWFLDKFLLDENIIENFIWKKYIEQLILNNRSLKTNETFILTPWIIFGGEDKFENYKIGATDVYLSLVGQTFEQINRNTK